MRPLALRNGTLTTMAMPTLLTHRQPRQVSRRELPDDVLPPEPPIHSVLARHEKVPALIDRWIGDRVRYTDVTHHVLA